MPKIRDLGINTMQFAALTEGGQGADGYRMCGPSTIESPPGPCGPSTISSPPGPCGPSTISDPADDGPCGPSTISNPADVGPCGPSTIFNPSQRNAGGLPDHAVIQLRQQLRQQIGRQLHG